MSSVAIQTIYGLSDAAAPTMKREAALRSTLAAAEKATQGALTVQQSPPLFTLDSTKAAWKTAVLQAQRSLEQLRSTFAKAIADAKYAAKWLETARSVASLSNQVLADRDKNGLVNALNYTISESAKQIEETAEGVAKLALNPKLLVGVGLVVLFGPMLVRRTLNLGGVETRRRRRALPARRKSRKGRR